MGIPRILVMTAASAVFAFTQTDGGIANGGIATEFEVASVKVSSPQSQRGMAGGPGTGDPDRYSFNRATLLDLISIAHHMEYFQVVSKIPLDQERFDIVAKLPTGATRQQLRVMLRNLLVQRFSLKEHTESRDFPVYELEVAKSGPKLTESGSDSSAVQDRRPSDQAFPDLPAGRPGLKTIQTPSGGNVLVRMRARQQPIDELAGWLHTPDGRPVVNKTGLTGKYDFTFEYAHPLSSLPSHATAEPLSLPDLFSALQQQLGLQLVRKKLPFDVVVVESVSKFPTEN
jgi:uncharacterized protein (TIGR03435 family)